MGRTHRRVFKRLLNRGKRAYLCGGGGISPRFCFVELIEGSIAVQAAEIVP
jgi:hypothetical protein